MPFIQILQKQLINTVASKKRAVRKSMSLNNLFLLLDKIISSLICKAMDEFSSPFYEGRVGRTQAVEMGLWRSFLTFT